MSYIPKYPDVKKAIKEITSTRMSIQQKLNHIKEIDKSELILAIKAMLSKDRK
jgi:hypothetical protein